MPLFWTLARNLAERISQFVYILLTTPRCLSEYHRFVSDNRNKISDEQLIANFQAGTGPSDTRELFDEVFLRYNRRVTAWCFRFTRDHELSLDLAQEIFLKAYRRFHTFRSDSKLSTWLYSITRNHCIDAVNKRSSELVDSVDVSTLRMVDSGAVNAEKAYARRQEQDRGLTMVYSTLNPLETRVMLLHYAHEVPIQKVTSILDLKNASGAKAYIVSARRKLAAAVQAQCA